MNVQEYQKQIQLNVKESIKHIDLMDAQNISNLIKQYSKWNIETPTTLPPILRFHFIVHKRPTDDDEDPDEEEETLMFMLKDNCYYQLTETSTSCYLYKDQIYETRCQPNCFNEYQTSKPETLLFIDQNDSWSKFAIAKDIDIKKDKKIYFANVTWEDETIIFPSNTAYGKYTADDKDKLQVQHFKSLTAFQVKPLMNNKLIDHQFNMINNWYHSYLEDDINYRSRYFQIKSAGHTIDVTHLSLSDIFLMFEKLNQSYKEYI